MKTLPLLHPPHPPRRLFGTPSGGEYSSRPPMGSTTRGRGCGGRKCPLGFLFYLSLSALTSSQSVSPKQRPDSGRYREEMDRDRESSHSFLYHSKCNQNSFVQAANKAGGPRPRQQRGHPSQHPHLQVHGRDQTLRPGRPPPPQHRVSNPWYNSPVLRFGWSGVLAEW